MKALTIKQPWAQLIVAGAKDIENRTWPTNLRERIAVHSSGRIERAEIESACDMMRSFIPNFSSRIFTAEAEHYPAGYIIGTVEIVDCVDWKRHQDGHWFQGPYGFVLARAEKLPRPLRYRGALGFWDMPAAVEKEIEAQLAENGRLFG